MDLQSLVIQTEAWAQEELAAKRQLLQRLEAQENAIVGADDPALVAATQVLEAELREEAPRSQRRETLVRSLGRALGVHAKGLTLQSVTELCEAKGVDTRRLQGLRAELRDTTAEALRRGRKVAILARNHAELLDEVLRIFVDLPESRESDGALLNAEA